MTEQKRFKQKTIAIVYDFDGTLSPQPMQEYTVLPELDEKPEEFWAEVSRKAAESASENMLVYMRLLLEKAHRRELPIKKDTLAHLAQKIEYFPGVDSWFDRINNFVKQEQLGIRIQHYVISAGLKEILEGVSIKHFFEKIYASEYHFNHDEIATFPKLLVTDTSKTQFLFRINKGLEHISESINNHMPKDERPIPFSNMIYIGDGLTDVPSMRVTKLYGGHAIAVYKKGGKPICRQLLRDGRVDFIAPADYSSDKALEKRMKLLLKYMMAEINYKQALYACKRDNDLLK